jgi:hypothetical protein
MNMTFPDQMHIERIRQALWRGREFGQAAVLIGAGFSRNAENAHLSARPFPLWADIATSLVDRLYPSSDSDTLDRQASLNQAQSTSGALRIAQEFEAAFGRDALDRFLLEAIVDQDYRPGKLHELLLELPWSDVFTTNYDTLLERGAREITNRKYDLVSTVAEIPGAMKPRIVKLHGSFPSIRPFIFTEEDFRTYPRVFASFVNLTQQAMMENVFCLLGFSGDDPNFLYWSGWVRDNLGRSAPQIYLCGMLNLNTAKRNLLHERNVVPIDLSPLFPSERFPDRGIRHASAVEWFLLSLEAGRPRDVLLWPHGIREEPKQRTDLPPITSPTHPQLQPERMFPHEQATPGSGNGRS